MLKNLLLGFMSAAFATSVLAASAIPASGANSDQTGTNASARAGTNAAAKAGMEAAAKAGTKTVTIQTAKTLPTSGKQMYGSYCAQCHGLTAKGDGPVANSLKTPPADLTLLSRNNGGKYPGAHVSSVLEYGTKIPSHGTAEMPVWGPILGSMDRTNPLNKELRISNLNRYLESIQAR